MKPWEWRFSFAGSVMGRSFAGPGAHDRIVSTCLDSGAAGIEGSVGLFLGMSEKELVKTGENYRSAGLSIPTFHLPFEMEDDIASFYEVTRRKTVRRMVEWIRRASLLGAGIAVIHPSTCGHDTAVEKIDGFFRAAGRSLEVILPEAEKAGLLLAFENTLPRNPAETRFGSVPEHLDEFRKRFGHPALRFCLDTGHALIAARRDAGRFFEVLGSDLVALHLQDNAGDRDSHLAPGHGRVDWREVFAWMRKSGFPGIACIEAPPFDFGPPYGPGSWKALIGETLALAESRSVT